MSEQDRETARELAHKWFKACDLEDADEEMLAEMIDAALSTARAEAVEVCMTRLEANITCWHETAIEAREANDEAFVSQLTHDSHVIHDAIETLRALAVPK
jgi:hypothetical protein